MDDNVVPLNRALGKKKRENLEILLTIDNEVAEIDDPVARQEIRDTLRRVAIRFFSSGLSGPG